MITGKAAGEAEHLGANSERTLRPATAIQPDVTVGIVTYDGRHRIARTLASLEAQTLSADRFEVLVVANGPDDGTAELIRSWAATVPFVVRVARTPIRGMAHARNIAIHAARGDYLTWLDDDDWVSPQFLAAMVAAASPTTVVLPAFGDVQPEDAEHGAAEFRNYINDRVLRFVGRTVPFAELTTAASFDAGKLVPTALARNTEYSKQVRTGMDVVFWGELIARHDLTVSVPPISGGAVYYRTLRPTSVSRSLDEQYEDDRIACIATIDELKQRHPSSAAPLTALEGGQAANLGRYLVQHPHRREAVLSKIRDRLGGSFPYHAMNQVCAEKLVITHAFPPSVDTSGLVSARRLGNDRQPFDVITHSMERLRPRDPGTVTLVKEGLGARKEIRRPLSFADYTGASEFTREALAWVANRERTIRPYREVYSRAMWPVAHVAAAAYKATHPRTPWTAEFSDPLLIDVKGDNRVGLMEKDDVAESVEAAVRESGFVIPADGGFFGWVETVTYALADRILFTNRLQREFMVQHIADARLAARVMEVSTISPHPPPRPEFYQLEPTDYATDPNRINIGYFGVFYATRGAGDLLDVFAGLDGPDRSRVVLHVFTDKPAAISEEVARRGLSDCIRVGGYLPYLQFLNVCTRLDWLLVADAKVADIHGVNPYLPSKYSDYQGSGSRIWALVEPGSTLDQMPVDAKTPLGDLGAAARFLHDMARAGTHLAGRASPGSEDRPS